MKPKLFPTSITPKEYGIYHKRKNQRQRRRDARRANNFSLIKTKTNEKV